MKGRVYASVLARVVRCLMVAVAVLLSGCDLALKTPEGVDAAPQPTSLPTTPPGSTEPAVPVESGVPADWQVYHDSVYGFRVAYPADWNYKVMDVAGPGVPDDWPVKAMTMFFPQSMAESLDRSGPPDPSAPAAIPPFNVEVCVGSMEQFRRVYPEPGRIEEGLEVNGASMVVERETRDDHNPIRYVVSHPVDPDVRVVLVDVITGFSDRAAANPEYLTVIAKAAASVEFTGEQPPASAPSADATLDAIRIKVAEELGVNPGQLEMTLQAVQFPDACLGLPAEGEVCAQVLTPGYGGLVTVDGVSYEVRADQNGDVVKVLSDTQM